MVPKSQQSIGKLLVLTKAQALAVYTTKICSNEKIFIPVYKYLSDKLIALANSIFTNCWIANNIRANTEELIKERKELQRQALSDCSVFLATIQIAHKVFHLSFNRIEFWGTNIIEVQNLIRNWMKI